MSGGFTWETARLRLREIAEDDLPQLVRLFGDPARVRHVGDGSTLDAEGCREWIAVCRRNYATRGYGIWAVDDRASGSFAGFAGISHARGADPAVRPPEVFYYFLPECDGRGLASEALAAIVEAGFARFGCRELIATIHPDNAASRKVADKCGFRLAEITDPGTPDATVWYRILPPNTGNS